MTSLWYRKPEALNVAAWTPTWWGLRLFARNAHTREVVDGLLSRLAVQREHQDGTGVDAKLDRLGHPIHHGAGLSGARWRQHSGRPAAVLRRPLPVKCSTSVTRSSRSAASLSASSTS